MDKGGEGTTRGWVREGGGNKRVDKGRRGQQMVDKGRRGQQTVDKGRRGQQMVDKEGREGTARGGQGGEEMTMERVGNDRGKVQLDTCN